ncbi:MAG TPA: phosphohistidine phosphatase SixA [Terriglobia bacterium]|nr:phosphohistidine phosphatase SixA [Terriglobia bacterium]
MSAAEAAQVESNVLGRYEFYIMRHGLASPRTSAGITDDAKRPLTPEGKKKTQEIARGLLRLGLELDWIVTSPLVRAVETAGIVSDSLDSKIPMDISDALRPGGSPEALIGFLTQHAHRKRVMVVGHEPGLGELAARLIGAGRNANLSLKKGGCVRIDFDEFPPRSPGQLVWWLTPRVMRKLDQK